MALPLAGLPLPLELVIEIVKYCEHHEEADRAYHGTEPKQFDEGLIPWQIWSKSANEDICNVRQVCKQLRTAAFESFGKTLGHRRFRLTQTGLQDLRDIASATELVPWVKTLTFWSAQLKRYPRIHKGLQAWLLNTLHGPKIEAHDAAIDKAFSEYEPLPLSVAPKNIAEVLEAFSGLLNLLIVHLDHTKYLGDWLTPEQHGFFIPWQMFVYGGRKHHRPSNAKYLPAPAVYEIYSFNNPEVIATILRAFNGTKIVFRDLELPGRICPSSTHGLFRRPFVHFERCVSKFGCAIFSTSWLRIPNRLSSKHSKI